MIGKNLKKYRSQKQLSQDELAKKVGCSKMAISYYEQDKREPDMNILEKISDVLNVPMMDFIKLDNPNLKFSHAQFRKNKKITIIKEENTFSVIEDYCERLFCAYDISGDVLSKPTFKMHSLPSDDLLSGIAKIKKRMNISLDTPVLELSSILEHNGIIMIFEPFIDEISGCNGMVNEYPYIAINNNFTQERQRFSICHELYHILFDDPDNEEKANEFAGMFLLPRTALEFYYSNSAKKFNCGVTYIAKQYAVSRQCVAERAHKENMITDSGYKYFLVNMNKYYKSRKKEPSMIKHEMEFSSLLSNKVIACLSRGEIALKRALELLDEKEAKNLKEMAGI